MTRFSMLTLLFIMQATSGLLAQTSGCERWTTLHPRLFDYALVDTVWDGSRFVALDTNGALLESIDGKAWTLLEDLFFEGGGKPNGLTWTGSKLLVVGNSYRAGRLFEGADPSDMSRQNPGVRYPLKDVASNGVIHVAVGSRGVTSAQNDHWMYRYHTESQTLGRVFWQGHRFFAFGSLDALGDSRALTSTDGVTWSQVILNPKDLISEDDESWAMAHDGARYVVTQNGRDFFTSTDGLNWETHLTQGPVYPLADMMWDGTRFIGVGSGVIAQSNDGLNWTPLVEGDFELTRLTWNGSILLATGPQSYHFRATTAGDWTFHDAFANGNVVDLVGNGNVWVSVGAAGRIAYSNDGLTWQRAVSPTYYHFNQVIWTGDRFVAVGNHGTVVTSSDGIHWQQQQFDTDNDLTNIAYNGSMMIARAPHPDLSDRYRVFSSSNGVSWTLLEDQSPVKLDKMLVFDGKFYGLRKNNAILRSTDGTNWDFLNIPTNCVQDLSSNDQELAILTYCGAFGDRTIYRSTNGDDWSPSITSEIRLHKIIGGGVDFIALGPRATRGLLTSTNGGEWINRDAQAHMTFDTGAWDGQRFCLAAPGVTASSQDAIHWNPSVQSGTYLKVLKTTNGPWITMGRGWQLISQNGIDWSVRGNTDVDIQSIVGREGSWLAMVTPQMTATSSDGLNWTEHPAPIDEYQDLFYAEGYFFLADDSHHLYRSIDGVSWEDVSPVFPNIGYIKGLVFHNETYIAYDNWNQLYFSLNGSQWHQSLTSPHGGATLTRFLEQLLWVNTYVSGVMVSSQDGNTWSNPFPYGVPESLIYGNGLYVAGLQAAVAISTDGLIWDNVAVPDCFAVYDLIWDGTRFMATCERTIYESHDGRSWSQLAVLSGEFPNLIFTGDHYLAWNNTRSAMRSLDGATWTPTTVEPGLNANILFLNWDGAHYVGIVRDQKSRYFTISSSDGISWTSQMEPVPIFRIVSNGAIEVAAGSRLLFYRPKGGTWQTANTPFEDFFSISNLVWSGSEFLIRGPGGLVATSANGSDWRTGHAPDISGTFESLIHVNQRYLALGISSLLTSDDGENWQIHASGDIGQPVTGNQVRIFQNTDQVTLTIDDAMTPHYQWPTYQPGEVLPTNDPSLYFNALSKTRTESPLRDYGTALRATQCTLMSLNMGWSIWRQAGRIFCNVENPTVLDYVAFLNNGACIGD